jgi:methylenetetrahydrofolate dehydrogenase (NADP+)/methenyltetrahydrofolate cyclohydrolase
MLLDGKKVSLKIRDQIKKDIELEINQKPGLAVVLVGNNPASCLYVKNKQKACQDVGIHSTFIHLSESIDEKSLLEEIKKLNCNPLVHGILVQFPLPSHINCRLIVESIDPDKDVDCFHPLNVGKLALGYPTFLPCTPGGIQILLNEYTIDTHSKHVVILGRSNLVGKPLALLLSQKAKGGNASVTLLHSHSRNIKEICTQADIIVAAIGIPNFLKKEYVKEGAVVIDVGINRFEDKIVGDVDFEQVAPKCSFITPVPGGVGPMTITMLLKNTLKAFTAKTALIEP